MEVAQDLSSQDGLADEVHEGLGTAEEHGEKHDDSAKSDGSHSQESLAVQKRLKSQKRAHEREVRELHARIGELESRVAQPNNVAPSSQTVNPYQAPQGANIDEHIHKAVSYALQAKDAEERKAREAEAQAHVHRQYGELQRHLESMNDKYDDYDHVVFGNETPFTPAMRDYSMTLPRSGNGSAGEVLYKLAKNPEELKRISKLHPLDQASEMSKLSHALISGGEHKSSQSHSPMGNIKSSPVTNSRSVTDKTPVSELRARMKAGWK